MTDDTPATGLPEGTSDDRFGPDTPGPEATAEQEAFVTGLLGSLRADDPEIPDHVAGRIDGILAELARGGGIAGAAAAATALGDADHDEPGGGRAGLAPVTVLPAPGERRAGSSTRTFRWIAGAAAAVVVVAGGAVVVRGALTGGSTMSSSAGASVAPEAGDPAPIRSSGTNYTGADLASKAQDLVRQRTSPVPASAASAGRSTSFSASDQAGGTLLRPDTLAACIEQLTGRPGVVPVAVDQGTFEGKPADIVVLPSADDPDKLEVWAIGPGCTKDDSQLYEYRLISSPSPDPTEPVESPSAPPVSQQPSAAPAPPTPASSPSASSGG